MFDKLSPGKHQLLLIILVRWGVIIFAATLVSLNVHLWEYGVQEGSIYIVLVAFVVLATLSLVRVFSRAEISLYEIGAQLALDLLFMFALFYFAGGAGNPFVSFLLFPLVVSAAILGRVMTYALVFLSLALYAALFVLPSPMTSQSAAVVDHSAHAGHVMPAGAEVSAFSMHVLGMWVNFAIIALLVSTVVVMMASRLQAQRVKSNQQREEVLKREQLLGIATEAASVAHHMGTPLSTIAVIVNELKTMPELHCAAAEIEVLVSQVEICKRELAQLRAKTELQALSLPEPKLIQPLLAEVRQEFQILRPQARVQWQMADNLPLIRVKATVSLRLALLNLLNNAADASLQDIQVSAYLEADAQNRKKLMIDIRDAGPGIDESILQDGTAPVKSSKHDSVGLGLYLSHASINYVEGTVRLMNVKPKGTLTRISLPVVNQVDV